MSKKWRVLMLSLFVVMLGAVSAFGATVRSGDVKLSGDVVSSNGTVELSFDMGVESSFDLVLSGDNTAGKPKNWILSYEITPDTTVTNNAPLASFDVRVSSDNRGDLKVFTVKLNPAVSADNYTFKGTVFVLSQDATDTSKWNRIISVDVELEAVAPEAHSFDIVEESVDITVVAGSSDVAVFTLVSKDGYCTSLDVVSSDVSTDVKGFTFTITKTVSGDNTFAFVNVKVSPDVAEGTYSFDVVLYCEHGFMDSADLYVTVVSKDFVVSYDVSVDTPVSVAAGKSTDVYIPVFGAVAPLTVTHTFPAGYVFEFVKMSGDLAIFSLFAPETAAEGTYSADVTITDATGRSQTFKFAWTVGGATGLMISEDKTVAVSVAYGSSADVTFTYYGAEIADAVWSSDIEFTDYVSLDIAWSGLSGDTGTIMVRVIPLVALADSYNTAIYFYGADSSDVSIDLTVNVTVPAISLNVAALGLSARVGSTDQDTITHSNAEPVSMKMSPDVPAAYGFKMTSSDELNTFTLSITPTALVSPDYRGRFVVTDEYGNVASASVTLHTVASADAFTITPDDSTVTLMAGSSTLVSLVASNNSGLVTWSYGTTSADITVSSSDNAGATQDNVRGTFRVAAAITASGDYRVPFTARDAAGHSKTATITVKVTGLSKTVQNLINSGYVVVENGRLVLTNAAFQSGSAPTAALVGNFYEYILMLNFNVTSWRLYLNDTRVAISAADGVSAAAGEEATITPDADDPKVALGSINRTTLTEGTSYNVELGVIPEGGTEEVRGSLGTITGGTSMIGVGSASGGCDAGLGMLVSALAAAFFIGRKRS